MINVTSGLRLGDPEPQPRFLVGETVYRYEYTNRFTHEILRVLMIGDTRYYELSGGVTAPETHLYRNVT